MPLSHPEQGPTLSPGGFLLTDDENGSPTLPFLNMAESSTTMMIMMILWQYSSHKPIYIPELLLCDIYGSLQKN